MDNPKNDEILELHIARNYIDLLREKATHGEPLTLADLEGVDIEALEIWLLEQCNLLNQLLYPELY